MTETADPADTRHLRLLAQSLDELFNGPAKGDDRAIGLALLLFPLGEEINGQINFVSNAHRPDMITALKQLAARMEQD